MKFWLHSKLKQQHSNEPKTKQRRDIKKKLYFSFS